MMYSDTQHGDKLPFRWVPNLTATIPVCYKSAVQLVYIIRVNVRYNVSDLRVSLLAIYVHYLKPLHCGIMLLRVYLYRYIIYVTTECGIAGIGTTVLGDTYYIYYVEQQNCRLQWYLVYYFGTSTTFTNDLWFRITYITLRNFCFRNWLKLLNESEKNMQLSSCPLFYTFYMADEWH